MHQPVDLFFRALEVVDGEGIYRDVFDPEGGTYFQNLVLTTLHPRRGVHEVCGIPSSMRQRHQRALAKPSCHLYGHVVYFHP
jgi:hypothetical protein